MAASETEFIQHEPCPSCGSRDNLARYSDGSASCFTSHCGHWEPGDGSTVRPMTGKARGDLLRGSAESITSRGLTEETCRKFSYHVGEDAKGRPCQIANYFKDGQIVAQKIRRKGKKFSWNGNPKAAGFFGQQLWSPGKKLVVTEGEIDALAVSQAQGNKWPVVSIANGAQSASDIFAKESEWLEGFAEVVIMFDSDDAGREAAHEAAQVLTPGKAKIATLPLKDAGEMLEAGRGAEIISAIWQASPYRPEGFTTFGALREEALKVYEVGLPWFLPKLTALTYGRRYGEVYGFGAGTGVGKTDLFTQEIEHTAIELGEKCAAFYFEQPPVETAKRIAGKLAQKRFHIPPEEAGWTPEDLATAFDRIDESGNVILYDHFGATDWDTVRAKMRYLALAEGVKHFFLDHLTALAAEQNDERKALEVIMAQIAKFAQAHKVCVYFISHLATPDGTPHEEGGRVMIRHFKGSRTIGFWSNFLFAMERNQQEENLALRHITTFRVLKDRVSGQATGQTIYIKFNADTGMLEQLDALPDAEDGKGFDTEETDVPW